jgi:hypothetical protein
MEQGCKLQVKAPTARSVAAKAGASSTFVSSFSCP